MEYIMYCDESSQKGIKFGDFFGGCIVSCADLLGIISALEQKKQELNLTGELKWTKITANYLDKYKEIIGLFFDFVCSGKIKVRIMFRQISDLPTYKYNPDDKYLKLYYQFIKHGFGLQFVQNNEPVYLRIYVDKLPDTKEKIKEFKKCLLELPQINEYRNSAIKIRKGDIAEVDSHDHILLQCVDIVLGAMQFRLNNFHKEKPEGQRTRGKRTIAKEKMYKYIYSQIERIRPNFNIAQSTGNDGHRESHWKALYEHWRFKPK